MQPVHVRRGWFEDGAGAVHFMVRYGSKPLPLDKAGSSSVEVGTLDRLAGVVDALLRAVTTGELDAQLAAAAQERSKAFKRRSGAKVSPERRPLRENSSASVMLKASTRVEGSESETFEPS